MPDKITEMFAFVITEDGNGNEGIPAYGSLGGMAMPLVGADMTRVDSLREIARRIARQRGVAVELRHFTNMEVMEVIQP